MTNYESLQEGSAKTWGNIWRESEAKQIRKIILKAHRKTPEGAEYVELHVTSDAYMRVLSGWGWEIASYPNHILRRQNYHMHKRRAEVTADLTDSGLI